MESSHCVGDSRKPVKLDDFRNVLIRQEETIIFALIERAQFPRNLEGLESITNEIVSCRDSTSAAFGGLRGKYTTFDGSLLDFMLLETEKLHALARRYTSPDENAFFPHLLPEPILPIVEYPRVLRPNRINVNSQIMIVYQEKILPGLTAPTSNDSVFGSTATADIAVLQALSKRIHFGKFIAEAKFQAEMERYTKLILANNVLGIMEALTNIAVENKVLERVKLKASTYGQDPDAPATSNGKYRKVDPQLISDLYRDFVMPLTKEVQVQYLLQRVTHPSIAVAGVKGSSSWLAALAHFGGKSLDENQLFSTESISTVFYDVNANRAAYGVLPIENSHSGMIKETQAQLMRSSLKVSAEILLIRSIIFAAKDMQLGTQQNVTKIFCPTDSDARLLAQAEQYWPHAEIVSVAHVSDAASRAFSEASTVAVTTIGAAESHGLKRIDMSHALASEVACVESESFIRFVVVSKGYPAATGVDKSCLSMEIKHEVGSLLKALDVWKKHGINLSSLESIYSQEQSGYDFFVQIDGHIDDENVRLAVKELQSVCVVKHLGSYPVAKRLIRS